MPTAFTNNPGIRNGPAITPRNIFATGDLLSREYASSGIIIDGALTRDTGNSPTSLLRTGLLLGKITTGGKYRNSIIGVTSAAAASSATSISVPAAVATEVARLIAAAGAAVSLNVIGPPTTAGTVATIAVSISAASGTSLTIASSGTIGTAAVAGSLVAPADGSQTPVTVLAEGSIPFLDVTDITGANQDVPLPRFLKKADLYTAGLVNVTTDGTTTVDASVVTWIKTQLKAAGQYTFSDAR